MRSAGVLALAASLSFSTVSAVVYKGFNYGATKSDGYAPRSQSDFQALFQTAKNLVGTSGFTSARLYSTIQAGTASDPTSAIPAAIAEDTTLLLTLWASGTAFPNELTALKAAITQYGTAFTSRVAGISIGSEDLYRNSPTGIAAGSYIGNNPDAIVDYIKQVRAAIAGTSLSAAPVGHVDTWTAWVNGSNQAVIDNSDWIGVDAYPYFQNTQSNGIENGAALFNDAVAATTAVVGGKPVWITETGWPVTGKTENLAVPSTQNAQTYWQEVGCPRFNVVNTWWYTLEDTDNNASPNPSFSIAPGNPLSSTPLFDLSCSDIKSSSSSAVQSSTATSAIASSAAVSSAGASTSVDSGIIASASASGSSASSLVSSISSAIGGGSIVTTGGGLSPTKPVVDGSAGIASTVSGTGSAGIASTVSGTGSASTPTVIAGGAGGSGNFTIQTTAVPTAAGSGSGSGQSGSATSSPAPIVTDNAAATLSGSVAGAIGALFAAILL